MRFFLLPRLAATAALAIGLATSLQAEQPADQAWITLFDGSSLEGWKSNEETPDCFSIEAGSLKVAGGRAHLFYLGPEGNASFRNFELRLRAMTLPGSNSGVYFHTTFQEKGWPSKGYEAQVNATHGDPKKTGSLYAVSNIYVNSKDTARTPGTTFKEARTGLNMVHATAPNIDGEWFDYQIRVKDNSIEIKVNGETTVRYTEPADGALPNPSMTGRRLTEGTFCLQGHDPKSTTFYQDIRVRRIP